MELKKKRACARAKSTWLNLSPRPRANETGDAIRMAFAIAGVVVIARFQQRGDQSATRPIWNQNQSQIQTLRQWHCRQWTSPWCVETTQKKTQRKTQRKKR